MESGGWGKIGVGEEWTREGSSRLEIWGVDSIIRLKASKSESP